VSPVQASCPACGAPINFKIDSSVVAVCEFCHSVVARGDRKLEDLGKVADLVQTGSPLDVGVRGLFEGVPFELTGRAQLGHQAGGMWDEWYAAFADGRWGWLAEAQGRFYLTFEQYISGQVLVPPSQYLELGQPVPALSGSIPFVVAEKGQARPIAAEGEIPYRLIPGQLYDYADLSGPRGEFATIDYSEERPIVFTGREVTLAELGLAGRAAVEREARRVTATQLSCPQCGGPLELRAPDKTERVTCPNCGSLLDVSQGRLQFLKALQPGKVKPVIPLGATGEFEGGRLMVIGFMQRSVEFEGVRYYWEEYLLYNPQIGFRWLVRSDDNWNFVQSVPPGSVIDDRTRAEFDGKKFKLYQDATARVEYVTGEFYWKVTTGELVRAVDYIHPPLMLSKEITLIEPPQVGQQASPKQDDPKNKGKQPAPRPMQSGEINWSLGSYVKRQDVEKAFNIQGLPDSDKVAPNQPFLHKSIYKYWVLLLLATFVLGIAVLVRGSNKRVFQATYQLQPVANAEGTQVVFSDPFELSGSKNIKVIVKSPLENSWLYVEGDLIDEATGLVQAFSMPVEYYSGVEGGESWREGSQSSDLHLSALPTGKYTMRLEAQWERWQQPATFSIQIDQGVPRLVHLFLAMLFLSILPVLVAFYHFGFEKRRWADSDYSPYGSSSES
jgi:ssDNA-binding Zn-finger/Zn-ribbon topoisomerase 1